MHQRLHPAPNHRKAKAAGDAEMFTVIFIDAFGMIDKQTVEHIGFLIKCGGGQLP